MINFPPYPIPVVTPLGDGMIVYVTNGATWENDCVCVALKSDGQWRHFTTGDIKATKNSTYGITANPQTELNLVTNLGLEVKAPRL